ncbi:hypothetical protein [Mycolicibacterium mageritense]|uniref:Uncharacterized protein n=1 Tax=Mycolicibacterium mageritense TaxID=53462 RepID=A0AAI8XPX6_MYCME|nr:hypothetical protein [Mycolicibacterium mageritense]BDY33189.1 hypothetical protein hbim_07164 [Mycolicibacterium mageritense]
MSDNEKKNEGLEFASVLIQHRKGIEHDKATQKLRDAVAAVKKTGKPAKVTVEIGIKPVGNIPNAIKADVKVNDSIPEEKESSMWFVDDNGGLHRNDPTQRPLWEDTTPAADGKSAAAGRD